ncbi:MAG TPA: hypothetical protein VMF65_25625 [Acidimicrobiales bacterium]|nr:hypothetical protein [Acidimicrobiales bacterium]
MREVVAELLGAHHVVVVQLTKAEGGTTWDDLVLGAWTMTDLAHEMGGSLPLSGPAGPSAGQWSGWPWVIPS